MRPYLFLPFKQLMKRSAIAMKPEPLPCLMRRPPSSRRNGSPMLSGSFRWSAQSMPTNPQPAFGRLQRKRRSICPATGSTQIMPRLQFASTGVSKISSITRVMSRSAKTPHASEKTLESLQDCAALLTIFCGSINPTQSPKIVTPPHSAASSSSVLCAFSK